MRTLCEVEDEGQRAGKGERRSLLPQEKRHIVIEGVLPG